MQKRQTPEGVATWLCNNVPAMRTEYGAEDEAVIAQAIREYAEWYAHEAMRNLGVHLSHCNFGENAGGCKYGDEDCPALAGGAWFGKALQAEKRAAWRVGE